jgi:diguanylate cyclase (GGDEF)-like protein
VLAAQKKLGAAAFADGLIPLPLSPRDFALRLPELAALKNPREKSPRGGSAAAAIGAGMQARPGEGILDPLTGFYTFAHFKEILFIEVKRARRYGIPLGLAVLEFDPLVKSAEPALRAQLAGGLSLAIRRSLRDTDYPVQLSVDRVLLLMPHTDLQGALVVSRRICERVEKASLEHEGKVLRPTLSIGVAAAPIPGQELSFADLVSRAQSALAGAVESGGNRVEFFDSAASVAAALDSPTE